MTSPHAELFVRCGHFLCGDGPKWKEQFAIALKVKTNSIDNMSKDQSRIPPGVWSDVLRLVEAREAELWPLKLELLGVTGSSRPTRDVAISAAYAGTTLGERTIMEINRRLHALPGSHPFQSVTLRSADNGGGNLAVPEELQHDSIERLKGWVEEQVRELGVTFDPFRTTNAINSFGETHPAPHGFQTHVSSGPRRR